MADSNGAGRAAASTARQSTRNQRRSCGDRDYVGVRARFSFRASQRNGSRSSLCGGMMAQRVVESADLYEETA